MSGLVAVDVAEAKRADASDHAAVGSPALVPVEPDAVEWCRTFWRSMADRLRRQAREHERQADHLDRVAAGLSIWVTRDFPWAHPARTAARLDSVSARAAAAVCRDGSAFARGVLKEMTPDDETQAAGAEGAHRWDDGGAQPARPDGPFYVEADVLARAENAPERDGAWTLGPRLPLEGMNEIRIADADRMAVRRADLGYPAIYELTDPDHADAPDAGRYSRFFRLDGAGDWPRIIETTEETRAMLASRNTSLRNAARSADGQRRAVLLAAENMEPINYLKGKTDPLGGGNLVVGFRRAGNSGTLRNDLVDADGERGTPIGEVRTPLQLLRRAHRIDVGQYVAGEVFAERFAEAQFALGRGTDYGQIRSSAGAAEKVIGKEVEEQRRWVFTFLDALGGAASPAAMAVWCVAGAQMPLDTFAVYRHFRMPGGQRWLTLEEAEAVLAQGLATLKAHLDAPSIEHNHRRHGLKIRVAGTVELAYLIGSRRFKMACRYEPVLKAWIGDRMAPRRNPDPGKAAEFRHWSVRAPNIAELVEASVSAASGYLQALKAESARRVSSGTQVATGKIICMKNSAKIEISDDFGLTTFG